MLIANPYWASLSICSVRPRVDSEMSRIPMFQPLRVVHQGEELHHRLKIVQRLPDPHEARCWRWGPRCPAG